MPRVVIADGFIATNVGNAFYNIGLYFALKDLLPDHDIYRLGDLNGNYWSTASMNSNNFELIEHIEADFFVLTGPMLSEDMPGLYEKLFARLQEKGTRILLISAGGYTYENAEVNICRRFLEKYHNICGLITRDTRAYDLYKDYASISHSGICCAWLLPKYVKPLPISPNGLKPYVTLCFDSIPEPIINDLQHGDEVALEQAMMSRIMEVSSVFDWKPKVFDKMLYVADLLLRSGNLPKFLNEYAIVRPTHCVLGRPPRFLFSKPNTYLSEIPEGYISLYANSTLTITDRVHAAVASLAYGTPTRLITRSQRSLLFERVGAQEVLTEITCIDQSALESKQKLLLEQISSLFGGISE